MLLYSFIATYTVDATHLWFAEIPDDRKTKTSWFIIVSTDTLMLPSVCFSWFNSSFSIHPRGKQRLWCWNEHLLESTVTFERLLFSRVGLSGPLNAITHFCLHYEHVVKIKLAIWNIMNWMFEGCELDVRRMWTGYVQKLQDRVIRNLGSVVSQMVLGANFQLLCLDTTKA